MIYFKCLFCNINLELVHDGLHSKIYCKTCNMYLGFSQAQIALFEFKTNTYIITIYPNIPFTHFERRTGSQKSYSFNSFLPLDISEDFKSIDSQIDNYILLC